MDDKYFLQLAEINDFELWMNFVTLVRHEFRPLKQDEEFEKYKQTVVKNINRKTAICVKCEDIVIGILIFSINQNCLGCMAVHPEHRKNGIASAMITKMLSILSPNKNVWVTTYREDNVKGVAPRALYKKFGFIEDELTMDFGYPHQKFVLHRC
ncbi:MAG: GNAT family N-acetyltransferase [Defluviitaleaceae bacterium]|nr:GNAT family N-acetyltransferase [Defluviitaleaceae bacterium]